MAIREDIIRWAQKAKESIHNRRLRIRAECRRLREITLAAKPSKRIQALSMARRTLESAAYESYWNGSMGRKLVPKLLLYHSLKYVMWPHWEKKEWLPFLVQSAYTYLCGRRLTPFGVLRFYFLVCAVTTLAFALLYAGGIAWTSGSGEELRWYHYVYFSGMTLTTLGYGDLHPTDAVRMGVAICEAFTGYLLLGLAVSVVIDFNKEFTPPPDATGMDDLISQLKAEGCQKTAEQPDGYKP